LLLQSEFALQLFTLAYFRQEDPPQSMSDSVSFFKRHMRVTQFEFTEDLFETE